MKVDALFTILPFNLFVAEKYSISLMILHLITILFIFSNRESYYNIHICNQVDLNPLCVNEGIKKYSKQN